MFRNEDKKGELEDYQLEKWEEDAKYRIKDWGFWGQPYYLHIHSHIDTELERYDTATIIDIIIKPNKVLLDANVYNTYKGQRCDGVFEVSRSNFKKLIRGNFLSDKRKRIDYHLSQKPNRSNEYYLWLHNQNKK